jgi:hypothetical protein
MSTEETPKPSSALSPDISSLNDIDRPVTLREMRSLYDTILSSLKERRVSEELVALRQRRNATGLWFVLVCVSAVLGFSLYFQIQSQSDLRSTLYGTCIQSNSNRVKNMHFYQSLDTTIGKQNLQLHQAIIEQVALNALVDCQARFH